MSVTAANINDLGSFVTDENTATQTIGHDFETTAAKQAAVFAACASEEGFQVPTSPGLASLANLFEQWNSTTAWVNGVRTALIEADNVDLDGTATAPTTAVTDYLDANGLDTEPTNIEIDDVQLYGQPPYSGLIDDPINAATGNFTDLVVDLDMPGVAREIAVARTYNSRAADRAGIFGAGWSSLVDARLDLDTQVVRFVLPDGAAAAFAADGEGGFLADRRRKMRLEPQAEGWVVHRGFDASWTFTSDGALTEARTSSTHVRIERDERAVTVRETGSGRWVRYVRHAEHGRAIRAEASDGRTARYRYDDGGHLSTVERPAGEIRYEVDAAGRITSVTDADGVVVCRNTYDRWGRVLTQVESHGRETTYDYGEQGVFRVTANDGAPPNVMVHDRRGRMTSMIDGLGNAMRLAYDDADNVTRIVDRTGATTTYDHDDAGNLRRRTDPDGLGVVLEHDDVDRPIEVTDRAGNTWTFGYDGDGRVPTSIGQPNGGTVTVDVDGLDRPTRIVDADGVAVELAWTDDSQVAALTDGLGNRTTFRYDDAGHLIGHETPAGALVDIHCDAAGRVLRSLSAFGDQQWTYSAAGRLVAEIGLDGERWVGEVDATGELHSVETGLGSSLEYERDRTGKVTAVTRDGVRVRAVDYDPTGRVVAETDALGGQVRFDYDAEGRVTGLTDAAGRVTRRVVDELGRTVRVVDPGGRTVTRTHHPVGSLASLTDADGNVWRYDVDFLGRCVATTDPLGNVTTCEYTPAGRLRRVTTPLGRPTTYDYDAAGRCRSVSLPDGAVVDYEYRPDGQVETVRRSADDEVRAIHVGYSAAGVVRSVGNPAGGAGGGVVGGVTAAHAGSSLTALTDRGATATIGHTPEGLLAHAVDPAGVQTDFAHDNRGRLTEHRTGGSARTFEYDDADRLRQIVDSSGEITTVRRDGAGAVVGVEHADGTAVRYVLGVDGAVEALRDGDDDLLVGFERAATGHVIGVSGDGGTTRFDRDPLGRIVRVDDPAGAITYTWDADDRLTAFEAPRLAVAVERADDGTVSYLVDGRRVDAPRSPDRTRDEHGRIIVDEDGRSYAYDDAGRLREARAGDHHHRFDYDDAGLLRSEEQASGTVDYEYGDAGRVETRRTPEGEHTYAYDARHRRVRERRPDGTVVDYEWDALSRLRGYRLTHADGTTAQRSFRYSTASRPCRIDDTPILWDAGRGGDLLGIGDERYLWHGADVLVVGAESGWSRRLTDDPFGADGETGIRIGHRGALACDHLILLGDRVFDPTSRQFLSQDPLAPIVGRLDFGSPYTYCYGDPVNHVDPTGRKPLSDEEYETWQENQNVFGRAKNFVADNWQEIAIVVGSAALGVLLTPVVGPIAAGAIAGAVGNAAITAVNGGSLGEVVRSGVIGGVSGAIGGATLGRFAQPGRFLAPSAADDVGARFAENALKQSALSVPSAVTTETLESMADPNRGFDPINVAVAVGGSGLGGGLAEELRFRPAADPLPPPTPDLLVPSAPAGFVRRPSGLLVPSQSGLITSQQAQLVLPSRQLVVPPQPQIIVPGAAQLATPGP